MITLSSSVPLLISEVSPDSTATQTDVLYNGSLCTLLEQDGDWYKVQYGNTTG